MKVTSANHKKYGFYSAVSFFIIVKIKRSEKIKRLFTFHLFLGLFFHGNAKNFKGKIAMKV